MINRQNWLDVRAYLRFLERVRQDAPATVKRARAHLRHLLEWADETPLPNARKIDPVFSAYLLTARCDDKPIPLSAASMVKCMSNARLFFRFARTEWPHRYKHITETWIEMLRPPRDVRSKIGIFVHQFYELDDVLKIARVSTETLRQERAKVAVCMLFLSGMRADALASIPISCVDLVAGQLFQLPERGVRTKGRKSAITYLLKIPELHQVVEAWDRRVRSALSPDALWYSTLTRDGMALTETKHSVDGRFSVVEKDVSLICQIAGVPYLSPHKLRHGHVVYALRRTRTMAELKAVSQNIMHSSVVTTDQVYGAFTGNDIQTILNGLGENQDSPDILQKLDELLSLLKQQTAQ